MFVDTFTVGKATIIDSLAIILLYWNDIFITYKYQEPREISN